MSNVEIPKVTVVDSVMGSGKTSAAINMINSSTDDVHFLYITPYLDEVKRVIESCPEKKFKQPRNKNGSKMENIIDLINKGENIVSTHALFKKFNRETIELTRINNYILIMDEVADVVDVYSGQIEDEDGKRFISSKDIDNILDKYAYVDENTNMLVWTDESYVGVFNDVKRMAELESLTIYAGRLFLWLFPVKVFEAFEHVYILTYLFDAQIQSYYYKFHDVAYEKKSAKKVDGEYCIVEYDDSNHKFKYDELINIIENDKLNLIGKFDYSLSSTWYSKATKETLTKLKNNIYNFFRKYSGTKSDQNIWTTFKDYKKKLSGKGYTKGFISLNARATNRYKDRTAIAYTVNRYINPNIKNYFVGHNVTVDEDNYALSEMLQFIWRSAIREGKEITIYIPSLRMRDLLEKWIEAHKTQEN